MPAAVWRCLLAVLLLGWPALRLEVTNTARAASRVAQPGSFTLQRDFQSAAEEFGVPEAVILSVSYNLTRWEDHHGAPSTSGGYGPMHLTHVERLPALERGDGRAHWEDVRRNPALHTLDAAARLLGLPVRVLERNPRQNIRGGAALLARDARRTVGRLPHRLSDWYGAVAAYSGSNNAPVALNFADAVFATIRAGAGRTTADGQQVSLAAQAVSPNKETADPLHLQTGHPGKAACPPEIVCDYVPAAYNVNNPSDPTDYGDYDAAQRPHDGMAIRYIVIHDTEGPYAGAVARFQDPKAYASANYVIRAADGLVTQMVPNEDVAWHAGNYYVNMHAIGIEHEGVAIEGATWYSEELYRTSAALVRYLARLYHVPLDRAHIVGHDDVPGGTPQAQAAQHWDPGPYWDWAHYMDLLGAPIDEGGPAKDVNGSVLTIMPDFATNRPAVTYCYSAGDCRAVQPQGSNFVYLHTAPDASAPLVGDPALHGSADGGTTRADDWGDKAVTGQRFYRAERRGDWDAVFYGGVKAWLYDPSGAPTAAPGTGTTITPRAGRSSIPVYGFAYPEATAYPGSIHPQTVTPLQYSIPAGQRYVVADQVTADYYWTPTQTRHAVVTGRTRYYQIFFNHRFAYVKASDVDVLQSD